MAGVYLARTAADVANEIFMYNAAKPDVTQVVVEGKDDIKLYGRFVDHGRCRTLAAGNKSNALDVLQRLDRYASRRRLRGYLVLIDADFDLILGRQQENASLVYTDGYNAECLIFRDADLRSLAVECGVSPLDFESEFLIRVESEARKLGLLRLINSQQSLRLNFDRLTVEEFFDAASIHIDFNRLVATVLRMSHPTSVTEFKIREYAKVLPRKQLRWHLVSGHDLLELVASYLRFKTGDQKLTEERVASILRVRYSFLQFSKTTTYSDIEKWEGRNLPLSVFDREFARSEAA